MTGNIIGVLLCSLVTTAIMVLMSRAANRRFAAHPRLPMQWSLPLRQPWSTCVNWTAPRRLALALMPALALLTQGMMIALTLTSQIRPGQEDLIIPAALFMGLLLIACHTLHLWLIDRTLQTG